MVPLLIALEISDVTSYNQLISGHNPEKLIELLECMDSKYKGHFSELLSRNEIYNTAPESEQQGKEIVTIKEKAVAYYIASRDSKEIDTRGIGVCNNEVFLEACNSLKVKPDLVLSDGYTVKGIQIPNKAVIKGDTKSACIAAASIVAKVYRDSLMKEYSKKYPHYAFEENAGYGTSKHIAGLKEYGPTEIHRMSFLNNILSY